MTRIHAEWWMLAKDDPIIKVTVQSEAAPSTSPTIIWLRQGDGKSLMEEVGGCLNGIAVELSRYTILMGWGKKEHLVRKADASSTATALCGRKPHTYGNGSISEWATRPLLRELDPDTIYICGGCVLSWRKLERTSNDE